ncbi:MAG: hypothetical protein KDD22_03970, partial [Bdellovibrionales bacterium]|nr:hypothetical protein [Bdellovibrionales bacterium]
LVGHFHASYFASALLIDEKKLTKDFESFFQSPEWDEEAFLELSDKYDCTKKSFVHRIAQILPRNFGMNQLFYFRMNYQPDKDEFHFVKEIHLSELHTPHRTRFNESYCRKWITVSLLKELAASDQQSMAGAQRSFFDSEGSEYLCFSLAYKVSLDSNLLECVTVGFRVDEALNEKVKFLEDPKIPHKKVSQTCHTCAFTDCTERVAPYEPTDRDLSSIIDNWQASELNFT